MPVAGLWPLTGCAMQAKINRADQCATTMETLMRVKALCLSFMLLATALLAGCNGKIAVVNTDKVFQESNAGKAGITYLDNLSKELQDELISLQSSAEKEKNKKAAQDALQLKLRDAQQRFSAEQQQVMNKISELYQQSMEKSRKTSKVDVILNSEAALSIDPKADITQQVIDEMNRTPVTFSPLAVEPEAAPAEAEAAPAAPGK